MNGVVMSRFVPAIMILACLTGNASAWNEKGHMVCSS